MECMLLEGERALVRMDEFAQAARALLHPLFVPGVGEQEAPGQELLGEPANACVAKCLRVIGAKLGEQPSRAVLPIRNQSSGVRIEEDEAQQIALTLAVEPAHEQLFRGLVPAA